MAARAGTDRPPPSAAPYIPPQISTQHPLLASRISLPPNTIILYAILKPSTPASTSFDALEHARRSVLSRGPIQDSILSSVQIGYHSCIYLFKLAQLPAVPDVLGHLNFDGLVVQELSSFSPPSISSPFPDRDKRILIARFYDAVRSRLIDDLVNAATKNPSPIQRDVKRFKDGFLMTQISAHSGWESKAITRPLVFCHLQIHFAYTSGGNPSHLVIHPILQPTPFLDISHSMPLPNGTPITLLPFGIPAYFLACYTGPTATLIKQFHAALQGLGSGIWDTPSMSPFSSHTSTFLIGWIKVENKQGEDKGLTIIYPTRLCLGYLPFSSSRATLDYFPELPIPLQPSPPATDTRLSLTRPGRVTPHTRRLSVITSTTHESLYSFRALTLVPRNLEQVTAEVGGYIDAVARERDRERERLKRERESGTTTSPRAARTSSTTPATATVISVEQSTSTSSTISSGPPPPGPPSFPGSSQALLPTPLSIPPSTSMQNFYPSPPQSDPILVLSVAKTSPTVSNNPTPDPTLAAIPPTQDMVPEAAPPPSTTSASSTFDPYNVDSTWTRSADNYLGMAMDNMDFAMDDISLNFNLDIEPLPNTSSAGGTMTSFNKRDAVTSNLPGMEFEDAFTDDDFSFFDQPSKPSVPAPTLQHSRNASGSHTLPSDSRSISGSGMSPSTFGDPPSGYLHPIRGSPQYSMSTTQLWTPIGLMDGFTPRSLTEQVDSGPSELLPSSPGHTTDSHSVPVTPNIYLEFDHSIKRPATAIGGLSNGGSLFQPIPFAQHHRQSDGKYAVGKFALPSPPPDATCISLPASPSGGPSYGWKHEYEAVTNPRISLINKLKRKAPPTATNSPSKRILRSKNPEEWEEACHDDALNYEVDESDMDSTEDDEEPEDNDNMTQSRPTTPPPSYLPPGPGLLATHFQHQHLLPLSVALRPPGASIDPLNLASNPPPSVPTPVSPAATLGAASEKSRSLEAAAYTVASQMVENPIWAEIWKANVVGAKKSGSVWSTDIKAVKVLMEHVPQLESPVTMEALFGLADAENMDNTVILDENKQNVLEPMEAPMISIGKGEAIVQVLPPALRFWEKLGLSPKGGQKDVITYVLFEDDGHKAGFMENWLSAIKNAYQGKHYGLMTPGTSIACSTDGIVPLRFDATFRKTLANLVSTLTSQGPPIVIFLVLPLSIMTLSSPVLRQIFAASKKVQASALAQHLFFEFIPEPHIYTALHKPSAYDSVIDVLSSSLYNRILIPVDRIRSRRITNFDDGKDDTRSYLMAPSFTLARPMYNKVSFVRAPRTSLDVMDRYTLLHVGYHMTGKWIIACCVDQRGECYDLGVWLIQSSDGETDISNEEFAVRKVWDFAMQFAKRVNIEWGIVFARLGALTVKEVEAWDTHLNMKVVSCREQPPLHHTLVCVVPDADWLFVPLKTSPSIPIRLSPSAKQHLVFTDVSSTTYAVFPISRIPISIPPVRIDLGLSQSFIAEPPISHSFVASPYGPSQLNAMQRTASLLGPSADLPFEMYRFPVFLLPHSTSILIRVPHPNSTCPTSTSMTHIHLLRTYHSASSLQSRQTKLGSAVPDEKQLLADVTRNYHDLAVLSDVRWKLDGMGGHKGLPFHLSATDAMRMALDKDWDRLEGHIEP